MEKADARIGMLLCAVHALLFTGCAASVRVNSPVQGNPTLQNPVTIQVEFDSRTDVSTFKATLDPGDQRSTDITASFSPPPVAGGQSTAVITVPQTPCHLLTAGCTEDRGLRVEARFRTSGAFNLFDVTAHTRPFRLQGSAAPPPPPPPASPYIDLSLSSSNLTVIWGNSASTTVTVEGRNGFSGMVDLTLENIPFGVTASFTPAAINVSQNGTATSTLNLATVVAATMLEPPPLRVRADPQPAGVGAETENFNLAVRRTEGNFDPISLRTTSTTCGSVTATVPPGVLAVAFTGQPFGQTNPGPQLDFSAGFAISPRCRVGVVVPPAAGLNMFRTTLWNLFFDPAIGASGLGRQIDNPAGAFTNGYLSKDDSLFVLITPNPPGSGCQETSVGRLWDTARGTQISGDKCFTASVVSVGLSGDTVTLNTNPAISAANRTWSVP